MNEAQKKLRLDRINAKGMDVNAKLVELKAQTVDMFGLDHEKLDKERRLKDYLDQINAARKRLMSGSERYGKCLACAEPFPEAAVDENPWLEVCGDCKASAAMYERWE